MHVLAFFEWKFIFNEGYFKFLSFCRLIFESLGFQSEINEQALNRTWLYLIAIFVAVIFVYEVALFWNFRHHKTQIL